MKRTWNYSRSGSSRRPRSVYQTDSADDKGSRLGVFALSDICPPDSSLAPEIQLAFKVKACSQHTD